MLIAMGTVGSHYEDLLADAYSWMLGDFGARVEAQRAWLGGIVSNGGERSGEVRPRAIDLGAGAGADAIALAKLGYDVVAVDSSPKLVAETRRRVRDAGLERNVEATESDLVSYLEAGGPDTSPVSLAVCLGDTLTHLDSRVTVQRMLRAARARVADGGATLVSYRDLSSELTGTDRIFVVRADASRSLTCFVEYRDEHVLVHDILHQRTERGWDTLKSAYPKLRLPIADVCEWLSDAGFSQVQRVPCAGGLVGIVAR
jgi:SAM-dependent methyltransferase